MEEKTLNEQIQDRREAHGWSQGYLAEAVRHISGQRFSQQSLAKLEQPGKNSRFMHFVLEALRRGEAGQAPGSNEAQQEGPADPLARDAEFLLDRFRSGSDEL